MRYDISKKYILAHKGTLITLAVLLILILCGVYILSYVFSDKPRDEWGALQVQRRQENERLHFQSYLRDSRQPKDKEGIKQFIKDHYGEKADNVLGYGFNDGQAYADIVSTSTYTLSYGFTNKNFDFIMCTRLSGAPEVGAVANTWDIACDIRDSADRWNGEIPVKLTDKPSWLFSPWGRLAGYRDTIYENKIR